MIDPHNRIHQLPVRQIPPLSRQRRQRNLECRYPRDYSTFRPLVDDIATVVQLVVLLCRVPVLDDEAGEEVLDLKGVPIILGLEDVAGEGDGGEADVVYVGVDVGDVAWWPARD